MKWEKLGLIFNPCGRYDWMQTHAQLPTIDHIEGDYYKIYFASRDKNQRSQIGAITIDINYPDKILEISNKPILQYGDIGFFDEHGVYPASIVNYNNKKYMYYIGWNKGAENPLFYASIGLAISDDGGKTFYKFSQAPIMQRSQHDPCLVTSPCVFIDNGLWRMYYVSGVKWERVNGNLKSYYHIKYAESDDGIDWKRDGVVAIDFKSDAESNIARASVIVEDGLYKMWYSYVENNPYRIGYAESNDGISWGRKDDEINIEKADSIFDNYMMCYPQVIKLKDKKYMFYNGNNFGKEGICLAVSTQ